MHVRVVLWELKIHRDLQRVYRLTNLHSNTSMLFFTLSHQNKRDIDNIENSTCFIAASEWAYLISRNHNTEQHMALDPGTTVYSRRYCTWKIGTPSIPFPTPPNVSRCLSERVVSGTTQGSISHNTTNTDVNREKPHVECPQGKHKKTQVL